MLRGAWKSAKCNWALSQAIESRYSQDWRRTTEWSSAIAANSVPEKKCGLSPSTRMPGKRGGLSNVRLCHPLSLFHHCSLLDGSDRRHCDACTHACRFVSHDQYPCGRGGNVLFGNAAAA